MDNAEKALLLIIGAIIGGFIVLMVKPSLALSSASAPQFRVRTYENMEEWEFVRDPKTGRTQGVRAKRHAEQT